MRTVLPAVAAVAALLVSGCGSSSDDHPPARAGATIVVRPQATRVIRPGFLGTSIEYQALPKYVGTDPRAPDPVLGRLLANLAPGAGPVLRVGGDSTDWTWWPVPGMRKPRGIRITLNPGTVGALGSLARDIGAKLILGIDLEADSRRLAAVEAGQLLDRIGRGAVAALELGNEPELYGSFAWFVRDGRKFHARPKGYSFPDYLRDFARIGRGLPRAPLAGPAIGGQGWILDSRRFLSAERVSLLTLHRYPLQRCYMPAASPLYPSIAHLLSASASRGLADGVVGYVRLARAHRVPLRIDEINTVSCGGARGVSNTFAAALWALDTMFAMASVGVDGVNVHTYPGGTYQLFRISHRGGRWRAVVSPEYYGLAMFARAAPAGARLLRVSGAGGPLRAWATRARDGTVRLVLINLQRRRPRLSIRVPVATVRASVVALTAPGVNATRGVRLGGAQFAPYAGTLAARSRVVHAEDGRFVVRPPAMGAVMMTFR